MNFMGDLHHQNTMLPIFKCHPILFMGLEIGQLREGLVFGFVIKTRVFMIFV